MVWVDHNKVLQNKSKYFDGGNKVHNFESPSNIKENEMYIFQSKTTYRNLLPKETMSLVSI